MLKIEKFGWPCRNRPRPVPTHRSLILTCNKRLKWYAAQGSDPGTRRFAPRWDKMHNDVKSDSYRMKNKCWYHKKTFVANQA